MDIARIRRFNQGLLIPFEEPADVVAHLGAVQGQEYPVALWALGLRTKGATEQSVAQALIDGTIVRTWPMRGTLHFVAPADVRWMLALLAPRVMARSRGRLRQLELDDATLARSRDVLVRALQGGRHLTRSAVYRTLAEAGIAPDGQRGYHILCWLAQEGTLCFGPPEGKQQTLVLLDEWVPEVRPPARDEALAELARRYFTSHGPATLDDFVWWTGLTRADARAGLDMAGPHLVREDAGGRAYWMAAAAQASASGGPSAYLLPVYDEYAVGYRDRSAILDPADAGRAGNGIFSPIVVVDGRVAGTWTRRLEKDEVVIKADLFRPLDEAGAHALTEAAERYGAFLGRKAVVVTGVD